MVRHLVHNFLPSRKTRSNVLWTVLEHTGKAIAISEDESGGYCVPLFSTPEAAEEWLMKMELEQHFPSRPLYPKMLSGFLTKCEAHGFSAVALDPPPNDFTPFPAAPISYMIRQAEEKVVGFSRQ